MPAAPPSPAEMLAAAAQWQRRASRRSHGRWKPFIPLVVQLHKDKWSAKEAADRCRDENWVDPCDYKTFHRWICRQYETLDAGGTLS
jgi:hypothetical protein